MRLFIKFYRAFAVILFMLATFRIQAQESRPQLFHYDIEEGLPSSEVYESYQDENGYIWFTTDRGIARYDGYLFKTFTTNDGLHSNTYFRVTPHGKNLYFCAIDGNIDGIRNEKVFSATQQNHAAIKNIHGWFDIMDISDDNNIFILKSNLRENFHRFNSASGEVNEYKPVKNRINDTLSMVCFNKACVLFRARKAYGDTITSVVYRKDIRDSLWSTFFLNESLVFLFHGNKLLNSLKLKDQLLLNTAIIDQNVWVCTHSGIRIYNNNFELISTILTQYSPSSLMKDYEGNLWITTLNKGVLRIPPGQIRGYDVPEIDHVRNKIVCLKKIKGAVVVVSSSGECGFIDFRSEKMTHYWKSRNKFRPYDATILNDTLYFYKNRLVYKNGKLDVKSTAETGSALLKKWGYGYTSAKFGNGIILSAYHLGVSAWDPDFNTIIGSNTKEFYHRVVHIINEDPENCLLGTVKGLYRVNVHSLTKVTPVHIPDLDQNIRINRILKDESYYYLSTMGKGLIITDLKKSRIISENNGLISNLVHTVLYDSLNRLWVATNKGLVRIRINRENPLNDQSVLFENLSSSTGLSGNYIIDILINENKLWVATNNGLNILSIQNHAGKSIPPKMIIEKLITGRRTFSGFTKQYIELSPDENDIRLLFTGICFEKPVNRKFYSYRLLSRNSDSLWISTNQREVQFTNLEPGNYTFQIQAINNNNAGSEIKSVNFHIKAHFTKTLWFRFVILSIVITIILLFIRAYFRRIKSRQYQLQQIQQAETRQREAELNTLRNQMNPHFVFNALNSIQSLVYKGKFEEASDFLVKFSRLMRDTLEFSKSGKITMQQEVAFLRNYLTIEKSRFPDLFDFEIATDTELLNENVHLPSMMVQPLVENAVKHAFKYKKDQGHISVKFAANKDIHYIDVYISDNGSGLAGTNDKKADKKHKSLGMQIINERLSLLRDNGYILSELKLVSPHDRMSTTLHLIIPILETS